jgi:hypothetical protein
MAADTGWLNDEFVTSASFALVHVGMLPVSLASR